MSHQPDTVNGKLPWDAIKERPDVPVKIRSTKCNRKREEAKYMLSFGSVGPIAVVHIQIEGIYAKALLVSGTQITLLSDTFTTSAINLFGIGSKGAQSELPPTRSQMLIYAYY